MESNDLAREIASLPPEAQKQVADFVAFLRARYSTTRKRPKAKLSLAEDPFIGMWRDREDMADSTSWVRQLREREWEYHE